MNINHSSDHHIWKDSMYRITVCDHYCQQTKLDLCRTHARMKKLIK
jgi:hypothetical protein